jgi:hypothetical protein
MRKALLGVALALWLAPPAHATTATRVLYAGDWTGQMEIFAVDPTGKAPVAQLTHWHGRCYDGPDYFGYPFQTLHLFAAPNGRSVLVGCGRALWLMRGDGADARRIGESPAFWSEDTMSPNGRWEARTDAGSVTVIRRSDGAVVARAGCRLTP